VQMGVNVGYEKSVEMGIDLSVTIPYCNIRVGCGWVQGGG